LAVLHAVDKGPMVDILVGPNENSVVIFRFIVHELANKYIAADILKSIAILAVILKVSFIESKLVTLVNEQSIPMIQLITSLAKVQRCHTSVQQSLAKLLQLANSQFLQELIGIADQNIIRFFLVPEKLFNELFLLRKQLLI
jgi:hypothetical protein